MELTYRQIRAMVVAGGKMAENALLPEFKDAFCANRMGCEVSIRDTPPTFRLEVESAGTLIAFIYLPTKSIEMKADPLTWKVSLTDYGSIRVFKYVEEKKKVLP